MNLEDKSMKELLALHNKIADTPAGPKTFATKTKLLARIASIAETKGINDGFAVAPANLEMRTDVDVLPPRAEGTDQAQEQKKQGLGIGELARSLLMDPAGYPHSLIAAMVNAQISGATATDKSVRWYAAKMRKAGIDVPARAKAFPADMNEKQSGEWLKTVRVLTPSPAN